jgi:Icc-related predicted phosphoesterase
MNLLLLSDSHGQNHGLPELIKQSMAQVMIHAGDLTRYGSRDDVRKFADLLREYKHFHKIVIAGNHDFCFEKYPDESRSILSDAGIIYLEDESIELDGVVFYGIPWTPQFGNWAFMDTPDNLQERWSHVPHGTDVLISHGPPRGILDVTEDGESVGGIAHRNVVRSIRPKLNVFGHIHECYGQETYMGVDYVNATLVNFQYELVNAPVLYNLEV